MPDSFPVLDSRTDLELATSVVPVLEVSPEGLMPLGTAFFVSSRGILFTARHVVDGWLPEDVPAGDRFGMPDQQLFILVPSGDTSAAQRHRISVIVTQVALDPNRSDVAVLVVDMGGFPSVMRDYLRPLSLAHFRPMVGERSIAIGYAGMAIGDPIDAEAGSPDLQWHQELCLAEGPVEEVHAEGRDGLLAPHPCFSIRSQTDGGMSGGPVVTKNGLGGVLSRGMSPGQLDGEAPYSLASLVSSGYHLGIDLDLGDGLRTHPINELIKAGEIRAEGPATGMQSNGDRLEVLWPD